MILTLHIMVALCSIVYAMYLFVRPSKTKVRLSYTLIGLTLGSGTYLVVTTHASVGRSTITGLVYLAVVLSATVAAQYKQILANNQ